MNTINFAAHAAIAKIRKPHLVPSGISGAFTVKNNSEIAVTRTILVMMRIIPHFLSVISDTRSTAREL